MSRTDPTKPGLHHLAALRRPGAVPRPPALSGPERDHAATVVAHVLHEECAQWSWMAHGAEAHREDALRIVRALSREGWGPRAAAA